MADIVLYTGETTKEYYSSQQLSELNKPLDPRLISQRKGGYNRNLVYIAGHNAIDQANRIFGYGNWAYKPLSLEQVVLIDPLTQEAVGIEYKAEVELIVRGAVAPIVDVGSQPVATWNVEDQIMQRRLKAAGNGGKVNESPFTLIEKREARAVIVEAHEQAKKGAVTDALKRALRAFGNQFGNELYGDGHVDLDGGNVVESSPNRQIPQKSHPVTAPRPGEVRNTSTQPADDAAATEQQLSSIRKLCERLGKPEPENLDTMRFLAAKELISNLTQEYRNRKDQPAQKASPAEVQVTQLQAMPTISKDATALKIYAKEVYKCGEGSLEARWKWVKGQALKTNKVPADSELTPANLEMIRVFLDSAEPEERAS